MKKLAFKNVARRIWYDLFQDGKQLTNVVFRPSGILVVIWDKPITMFNPTRAPLIDRLLDSGFVQEKFIDCTTRATDRSDTWIYHLLLPVEAMDLTEQDKQILHIENTVLQARKVDEYLAPEWLEDVKFRLELDGWTYMGDLRYMHRETGEKIQLQRVKGQMGQYYRIELPTGVTPETNDPVRLLKYAKEYQSITQNQTTQR